MLYIIDNLLIVTYFRQIEDIRSDNEDSTEEEEDSQIGMDNHSASNKNLNLSTHISCPKVVLRRLSASQLSSYRSTPVNSFSPTNTLDGWDTPKRSVPILYSPSQPGPSTSSPVSFKDLNSNGAVGCASKVRRLSSFFQNENELISSHYETRERNIPEIRDDSESD